jgi:hypothetical protein
MQRVDEPPGFADGGCWARVVWWPEDEVSVLAKREGTGPATSPRSAWAERNSTGLSDADLQGHDEPRKPNYTDYSRVTYIRKGNSWACRHYARDCRYRQRQKTKKKTIQTHNTLSPLTGSHLRSAGLPIPLRGTELGYEDCTQLCFDSNDMGDAFAVC